MKRLSLSLLLAFLTSILITGCASQHPTSGVEALATLPAEPISVWVAEKGLDKKIVVRRKKVEKGPNGATLARVELANCSSEVLEFEVQTLYKDLKGYTLNNSPWVRHIVKPGKSVWIMSPVIDPGTARFFIQIQPAPPRKPLSGPMLPNFGLVPGRLLQYALTSC